MVRQWRHHPLRKDETLAATTDLTRTDRIAQHDIDSDVEDLALELVREDDPDRRADLVERMVLHALPLADAVALRYSGRGIETDDLIQVARTALVKAVHRYRPGTGPGFAAFASPTVSGEVKRWFRDHGWAVRPPRRVQELRAKLVTHEEQLRHELARNPCDAELADALGVTPADVGEARVCSAGYHAVSLDAPSPSGACLADHILVTGCPASAHAVRDALRRSVARLSERERVVLQLRFVEERTQSEIGDAIGVSQMQVSRILRTVLDKLRADLLHEDGPAHDHAA